jgi:probable DNA metabolism protein
MKDEENDRELFCEYEEVEASQEKAEKVLSAVRGKLSEQVYHHIYVASLSEDPRRADRIYRFLVSAFHFGPRVCDMLQRPEVYEIFRLCRSVQNESHQLIEFLRFSQTGEAVLVSRIGPKNDVLTMLSPHFADRLPEENWIIYDEKRKKASVHPRGRSWFLMDAEENGSLCATLRCRTDEAEYEELWKQFFNTVAIMERRNPSCQRTHLPLRFRPYMTEFQE